MNYFFTKMRFFAKMFGSLFYYPYICSGNKNIISV